MTRNVSAVLLAWSAVAACAAEDIAPIERRLPPPGIDVPAEIRQQLSARRNKLYAEAATLAHPLLPDAEVYLKGVEFALRQGEFYGAKDFDVAAAALEQAAERLAALRDGKAPWTKQRGLLVRGYRSKIDDSVQPYALVIPEKLSLKSPVPLYVWLHGRGDKNTDLHFIHERQTRVGQIAPGDAIVLHAFGRHCLGFKSAGEIDVLEAIDHAASQYPIDRDRIVLMGFSMGGAGCWHLGAHYADRWVAISPGAGFAETARYQNLQPDSEPWYVQKLWGAYDVPCYTRNLFNLPVVAYSGEKDKQIQAARVMEEAFAGEGQKLCHLIGPGTGHKYHPDTLKSIMTLMKQARERGLDRKPRAVHLQTRTLRYHRLHWVSVQGLAQHWADARVDARLAAADELEINTVNVTGLHLAPPPWPRAMKVTIDGQSLRVEPSGNKPKEVQPMSLVRSDGRWQAAPTQRNALAKTPGLQGPIDDAFLEPFLVVLPTGKCRHAAVQRWVDFEQQHFLDRWQALFRGKARVKNDVDVTGADARRYHLVLWGDPQSNAVLKKLADWGPIRWGEDAIEIGTQKYDAAGHVPIFIYPNRDALDRYIVVNSGPTFREGHDRTNSQQNPKLPDWAVIDLSQPPGALAPGKVVAADFFDESWQLKPTQQGAKP